MNKLMHNIINKTNTINLVCGIMALELEQEDRAADGLSQLKKRLRELLVSTTEGLYYSRRLLTEVIASAGAKPDCYEENEHLFKEIRSTLSAIEEKKDYLESLIGEAKGPLPEKDIIAILHGIEKKALCCGTVLKEMRRSFIKCGIYKTEGEKTT